MQSLEEHLYSYLMEYIYEAEQADKEYQRARKLRDVAEKEFSASLTHIQMQQFSRYMDQENHLSSLTMRRMFQETLSLFREMFR